jgi:hypothetical protein
MFLPLLKYSVPSICVIAMSVGHNDLACFSSPIKVFSAIEI